MSPETILRLMGCYNERERAVNPPKLTACQEHQP